jgi:Tol biopolymer transport system component
VPGDTNAGEDLFVRDIVAGTTKRLNVGPGNAQANGSSVGLGASDDGTQVLFFSDATNLVAGDTNGVTDLFVADVNTGAVTRVSVNSAEEQGDDDSYTGAISGDGHHVVFESNASNLVAGDTNSISDVFVRDIVAGTTTRESVSSEQAQANGSPLFGPLSGREWISTGGNVVTFSSRSTNLVAGDTDGAENVFIRDRSAGTTTRIVGPGSTQMQALPLNVSGDGSTILFFSATHGIVPMWDDDSVSDPTNDPYIGVMYAYHTGSAALVPLRGYGFFENVPSITSDATLAIVSSSINGVVPGHDVEFNYLMTVP